MGCLGSKEEPPNEEPVKETRPPDAKQTKPPPAPAQIEEKTEKIVEPPKEPKEVTTTQTARSQRSNSFSELDNRARHNSWSILRSNQVSPDYSCKNATKYLKTKKGKRHADSRTNSWDSLQEDKLSPSARIPICDSPSCELHQRRNLFDNHSRSQATTIISWDDDEYNERYNNVDRVTLPLDIARDTTELKKCIERISQNPSLNTATTKPDVDYIYDKFMFYRNSQAFCRKAVEYGFVEMEQKVWNQILNDNLFTPGKQETYECADCLLTCLWFLTEQEEYGASVLQHIVQINLDKDIVNHLNNEALKAYKLIQASPRSQTVKAFLDILHGIVRKTRGRKKTLKTIGILEILQNIRDSKNQTLAGTAFLVQAHLVNEVENKRFNSKPETFKMAADMLDSAIKKTPYHTETIFKEDEVVEAINRLASMDVNIERMLAAKVHTLYVQLLKSSDTDLSFLAARGIWMMSFKGRDQTNNQTIKIALQSLRSANDESIIPPGAVWTIKGEGQARAEAWRKGIRPDIDDHSNYGGLPGPLYLSYPLNQAEVPEKLLSQLNYYNGITVMSGNDPYENIETRVAMIELAPAILVGLSESYKDSPLCRFEAEYAHLLGKKLIPLTMEPGYLPDGWLADLLTGENKNYDFTRKELFKSSSEQLAKTIWEIYPAASPRQKGATSSKSFSRNTTPIKSQNGNRRIPYSWSKEEVAKWFNDNNLQNIQPLFSDVDGPMLEDLMLLRVDNPDAYFREMFKKMNTISVLQLTKYLRDLLKQHIA